MQFPDLVTWLAHAPAWVRAAVSFLLMLWTFCTTLALAFRLVPEATYVQLERAQPRLGHALRAARKFGTDVAPFLRSLALAFARASLRGAGVVLLVVIGARAVSACDPELRRLAFKALAVSTQCASEHQSEFFARADAGTATDAGE